MPIPLGSAILNFCALMGLALAAKHLKYPRASVAFGIGAFVVLAWGIVGWLWAILFIATR
jgi:hypothetical protein